MFLLVFLFIPVFNKCKMNILKYVFILLSFFVLVYLKDFSSYLLLCIIFILFNNLQGYLNDIFNIIDVEIINFYDIKQGDILTEKSLLQINKDLNIDFNQSPLQ